MATLFIADLHLGEGEEALNQRFVDFLRGPARAAEALYILGDLFEAWLGDDLLLPYCEPLLHALRELTRSGVPVYLMHGNRDFLLGEAFCELTGCTLLDEPACIDLYGTPTLLMHGDSLCTDDHSYQAMRQQLRDPQWIAQFLQMHPRERIEFARSLRERSQAETGMKDETIMDVNQSAVQKTMQTQQVRQLIHGHTHRPAQHALDLDGQEGWRHVLPDWQSYPGALRCDAEGCRLCHLDELEQG